MVSNVLIQEEAVALVRIGPSEWTTFCRDILEVERTSFPASLRDSAQELENIVRSPSSIVLGVRLTGYSGLAGYLAADRLELFAKIPGVTSDPNFGKANTLYLASVAVHSEFRHRGLGTLMMKSCIDEAYAKGFKRVTAHVDSCGLERSSINFQVKQSFGNWYGTNRTFDYIEFY